jgi:hypothetical protein
LWGQKFNLQEVAAAIGVFSPMKKLVLLIRGDYTWLRDYGKNRLFYKDFFIF